MTASKRYLITQVQRSNNSNGNSNKRSSSNIYSSSNIQQQAAQIS